MKEYQNTNFSLLSQEEIDVLVAFLTNNNFIESDVLSQESIDKLVALLLGDMGRTHMEFFDPVIKPVNDLLEKIGLRQDISELCVLSFKVDESGFMKLFATNKKTGMMMEITPATLDENEKEAGWGFCMAPVSFNRLARMLDLKYAAETYDELCKVFAEKTFGSEDAQMPAIYFPTNEHLLRTLL